MEQKMKSRFKFVKAQAYTVINIFPVISQQVGVKVSIGATAIETEFSKC